MGYTLALSFSNNQFACKLPIIFVGLAFKTETLSDLHKVHTKNDLFPNLPSDLPKLILSKIEDELKVHQNEIIESRIFEFEKPPDYDAENMQQTTKVFVDGYLTTISKILSSNLPILSEGIDVCYVHEPISKNGTKISLDETLFSSNLKYKQYELVFQGKENFNDVMEIARLFATNEYLKKRRKLKWFVYQQLRNETNKFFQVFRVLWPSPDVQTYVDSFVGFPELILKNPTEATKHPLIIGNHLNIFPIANFCRGVTDDNEDFRSKMSSCLKTSNTRPFGTMLSAEKNYEVCSNCSKKSEHLRCLSKNPKCDGAQILCGNEAFAGNVCNGNFAIYLTIFGNSIKIGRSIYSRTVGRLIEQAAFDALVFYPVNSLIYANFLEKEISRYLKTKLKELEAFGITNVRTSVKTMERLEHIRLIRNATDVSERRKIYSEVKKIFENSKNPHANLLSSLESSIVNFSKNWMISESLDVNSSVMLKEIHFKKINGSIEGVIGHFLFLDNKKIYSLKKLQGCVVMCP